MILAERFARAAEALEGTQFRLHGRRPETGLDCIGLVARALADCGQAVAAPRGYALRNTEIDRHLGFAARNGFHSATGPILRGDLLLVVPGPAQHHLLVSLGGATCIHAHAGLRLVVRQPQPRDWPVMRHWRLAEPA